MKVIKHSIKNLNISFVLVFDDLLMGDVLFVSTSALVRSGHAYHASTAACINCLISVNQTCLNRLATLACLVTKQCLMVFGRQTFVVFPGP